MEILSEMAEDAVLGPISLFLIEEKEKLEELQHRTDLTSTRVAKILSYKVLDELCQANGLKGSKLSMQLFVDCQLAVLKVFAFFSA